MNIAVSNSVSLAGSSEPVLPADQPIDKDAAQGALGMIGAAGEKLVSEMLRCGVYTASVSTRASLPCVGISSTSPSWSKGSSLCWNWRVPASLQLRSLLTPCAMRAHALRGGPVVAWTTSHVKFRQDGVAFTDQAGETFR